MKQLSSLPLRKFKDQIISPKIIMTKNFSTTGFFLAVLSIFIISLAGILYLYFILNPQANPMTANTYQPVTQTPVTLNFNLQSPDDNMLVFDKNLLIQGQTSPNCLILITLNDTNLMLTSSAKGDFSQTLTLQPQVNKLMVVSFDTLGNSKGEEKTIFYAEEKI